MPHVFRHSKASGASRGAEGAGKRKNSRFSALPVRWQRIISGLGIAAAVLFLMLALYIHETLGSLLQVMVG